MLHFATHPFASSSSSSEDVVVANHCDDPNCSAIGSFEKQQPSPLSDHLSSTKSIKRTVSKLLLQYEHDFKTALSQEQDVWNERKRLLTEKEQTIAHKEHVLEQNEREFENIVQAQVSKLIDKKRKEMMSDYEERETKISKIEKRIASSALLESRLGPNQVIRLNVGGTLKKIQEHLFPNNASQSFQ